ncbi:MAG: PKD domain-containing protein, partial [Bacteroidetes bacterium]|nr:PKD domain-containing protein [Bacteroidota bacterium]
TQNVAQSSISQTLTNSTNAPITVKYVVTPVSSVTGNCTIAPFLINATVNPSPIIADATASVCSGNAYTFVSTNNADIVPANTTYTWTILTDNNDLTGQTSASTSQANFTQTLVNTTNVAKNIEYTVTPTYANCTGASFKLTLTVNPKPIVPDQSATICSGESFTISPTNDPPNILIPAGTKYTWRNDLRGFLNYAAYPYMFYVPPNDKAGLDGFFGGSPTYSGIKSIDPSGINLLNWNDANQLNGLIGSSLGDFFAYKLTGYFIPSETGTYTFSVEGDDAVDVLIDGNAVAAHYGGHGADPVGTHTGTISMIAGQSYAIQVRHQETWGGEALKMYWKRPSQNAWQQDETELYASLPVSNTSITGMSAQATPQSSISQTLVNTTNVPVQVTYVVKPVGVNTGNCTGSTFNVNVTVNPKPSIANKTATICSGGSIAINPVNAIDIVPANTTYTWTISSDNNNITGQTTSSTAQSNFAQTLVNTTNAPQTIVYTVTPTSGAAGNCVGATFTITITVNPIPVIPNAIANICSGNAFTITPSGTSGSTIVPSGTTYTWTVAANSNVTGQSNQFIDQNSISQTLTNTTNASETVIYTVTPLANGCAGNNFTVSVVVAPKPIIANMTATICSDDLLQITPSNGTNIVPSNTEYTWTILTNNNSLSGQSAQNVAQTSISQHLINATSSIQTITYTVTPTAGSCTGATFVLTVTVYPTPAIANKVTTVCSDYAFVVAPSGGSDIIPASTKYTWTILNNNNNLTGQSSVSVLQNTISQTLHNTTDIDQTIVYTVTPVSGAAGACIGLPFTTTVTVSPTPVIPALTDVICSGGTFTVNPTNAGTTIVPAGTTYTWTIRTNNNALTGQSVVSSAQNNISQTLVNSSNTDQNIEYTVTPKTGSCIGAPFVLTITVHPTPVIPNQNTTVCSGGFFTVSPQNNGVVIVPSATTYTWTVVQNVNVTGAADNATPANNISQQLYNTSATDQTVVYTVTPTAGNCVGASFEISVIVHAKIRPVDQLVTVCSGEMFNSNAVGSVPVGTQYSWLLPTVTGGLTGGATGTAQNNVTGTLINPTNTTQSATYTVTPVLVAPFNLCEIYDYTTTVTVQPKATIANISTEICSSETYTVTPTNGGLDIVPVGTTYTWTIQTNNNNIVGQNSQFAPQNSFTQQLNNLTNTDQTIVYIVTPRSGMCAGPNFTVTITVHPKPNILPQFSTICSGTAFVISPINNGNNIVPAGTTYTWNILTDNNNLTGQSAVAISSNTISQVLTNTTNQLQAITYQVLPTSGAAGGCVGNNFFVNVSVTPKPFVVDQQTEICSGATFSIVPSNGNGNIVPGGTLYNWTIFTDNINITGQANETNEHPVIYQTLQNTSNVDQTIVYEVRPRTGACIGSTFKVTVVVHPTPTIPNQVLTICSEAGFILTPSSIVGAVVPSNSTYTWTIATNNNSLTGQQAQNIGQSVISQTLTNTTNIQQAIVYTVAPLSGVAGGCAGSPFTLTVKVDPKPSIANVVAEVCSGGSFVAVPSNGNGNIIPAATTYTYTIQTNNNLITGQSNVSAPQNNISQALVNTTNIDQVIVYNVTPTSGNCIGVPFTVTVTVHPKPSIPAALQTICSGSTFLIAPINSGSTIVPTNTSYTWTVANNPAVAGATNQAVPQNNISQTLTTSAFTPQDVFYTVTPTSGAAGACVGSTFTVTITVNPIPTVNSVSSQVICNGSTTTGVTFTGNVAGTVYNWTNSNTAIGLGASGANTVASFVTTNTTNATISGTITATPVYTNAGLGCTGTATSFTIAVNPIPTVNAVANQTICVGGTTTVVTPTGNVAGTVYNWTNSNTAIGLAASGTGNIPSFVTTNAGNTPISGTITITPTYTNGGRSCTGAPITFSVTVNPIPTVNSVSSQIICNGSTTTGVTFTGNVAGTVYNWTNSNIAIGLGASGTNTIASFVTTNTTNATISGTITATPVYTNAGLGCTGAATSFTIAVNPIPTVNAVANQELCTGAPTALVSFSGFVPGTIFNWTNSNTSIGLTATGTGNIPSFTTINTGTLPQVATIIITPKYTNLGLTCTGATKQFTYTVNAVPVIANMQETICSETRFTTIPQDGGTTANIVPPNTKYTWTVAPNTNVTGQQNQLVPQSNISQVLTNLTNVVQTVVYTVTPISGSNGACFGNTFTITVTVNPKVTVPNQLVSICSEGSFSLTPATFTGVTIIPAGSTFSWPLPSLSGTITGAAAGATQNFIFGTLTNPTNTEQTATYTITPLSGNCTGNVFTISVEVKPKPHLSSAIIAPTICTNSVFNYTAQSTVVNTSFSWSRPAVVGILNPANSSNGNIIKEILINTTAAPIIVPYTFTLTARGCVVTETITVTILPTVQAQFASNNSAINCAPFVYNTYSTPSDFASVRWYYTDNNNNIIGNNSGYNSSFTFIQPGNYKASMIAYHPNGCPDTLQKPVVVTTSAIVDFSPIDSVYCGPSKSVTFTNNTTYAGQGSVSYKWLVDGVVVSSSPTSFTYNFVTLPSQIGVKRFTVSLEATTTVSGCVSVLSKNIYILPTPKASFTATPPNGCIPLTVSFVNTSLYADSYKWYVNDSLFSTSQLPSPFIALKSNQIYTFKLVASANSGCVSDSSLQVVTTLPNPVVNFDTIGISQICKSAAVTILNKSYIGAINNTTGLTYQWKINGQLQSSMLANPNFWLSNSNPLLDSVYLIQLIVTNTTGCKDSVQKPIVVHPAPKPIFSIVGGTTVCARKNLVIGVTNSTVAKSVPIYNWSIRNTGLTSTLATITSASAAQPNFGIPDNTSLVDSVYEIKLTATSIDGCVSDTTIAISIHPRPNSTVVLNNVASCGAATFIATASNAVSIKNNIWSWTANSPNAPTPVITYNNNTAQFVISQNNTLQSITYRIKVLDTTAYGCLDTISTQFILYPKPQARFAYTKLDSCSIWKINISNTSVLGDNDLLNTGTYEWVINRRGALQQASAGVLFARYVTTSPIFNFTNTGTSDSLYDVKLIIGNKYGCLDSSQQTFTVHAKPRAKILAGITVADAPFNITKQNNLLAVDYPSINGTYTWRVLHPISKGVLASTFDFYSNPYTIANSDDSVIVQLIVSSLYGCAADTASVLFKTLPSIVADFTRSDSVDCSGNTAIVFTDISISKSAAIVERYWDFGDGVKATGAQVSHTYKLPGIYWVSLYVKDANGIVSNKTYRRVVVIGQAVVDFVATNACEGAATFFINNSQLGYGNKAFSKVFWDFGDGTSSNLENPSHVYTIAGTYNVTLTLKGDSSCILSSKTKPVIIFGKPAADFNYTDNCINLPIQFTNKTVPGNGESTYTVIGWNFGDGITSTLVNPQHTYTTAGIYNVRLIVSSTICAQSRDTITKQIKVTIPRASMVYPLVKATRNRALTLVAQPGGLSYVWSPSVGLLGPNQQSPTAKYTLLDPNKINYTITIKDSSGCVIKDAQEVWVFDKSEVYVPTAFSPNGDGANDVLLPFYINIAKLNYFRIYDRWGKLVFETNNLTESWNGLVNGKQAPLESYAWTVACVDADGKLLLRKGMVTMIRD